MLQPCGAAVETHLFRMRKSRKEFEFTPEVNSASKGVSVRLSVINFN